MGYVRADDCDLKEFRTNMVKGAGMSRAYATEIHPKGWLIPQAVQFIPAVLILIFIWFTPGMLICITYL